MYELLQFSMFDSAENFVFDLINGKIPPRKNVDIGFFHHDIDLLSSSAYLRKNCLFRVRRRIWVIFESFSRLVVIRGETCGFYEIYEKVEEIFKKYSHQVLHDNIGYNIRMELYAMRMIAIHDLIDEKILKLPEDTSKSSLGMHIFLK